MVRCESLLSMSFLSITNTLYLQIHLYDLIEFSNAAFRFTAKTCTNREADILDPF